PVHPAGQQLVHIGLVAGVPDDLIGRGIEDPVQRDGQLYYAQVRTEMTAIPRYRLNEELADLSGELHQLILAERLDITRAGDRFEQRHLVRSSQSSLTTLSAKTLSWPSRAAKGEPNESIRAWCDVRVTFALGVTQVSHFLLASYDYLSN